MTTLDTFTKELDELRDPDLLNENWDGYDAEPLKPEAFQLCKDLMQNWRGLNPTPIPCNDGNIALEWDKGVKGNRSILTVVPKTDGVAYGFLSKSNAKDHGWVAWHDTAGLEKIRQLTRHFIE